MTVDEALSEWLSVPEEIEQDYLRELTTTLAFAPFPVIRPIKLRKKRKKDEASAISGQGSPGIGGPTGYKNLGKKSRPTTADIRARLARKQRRLMTFPGIAKPAAQKVGW
jgi:hypothetical protein